MYIHTACVLACMYVYCTYTHVHGVLPGYLKACRSNMLSLLQFNTICGEACMHSKIVKNLCLVQIILGPKLKLQAICDVLYLYVYDDVLMHVRRYVLTIFSLKILHTFCTQFFVI